MQQKSVYSIPEVAKLIGSSPSRVYAMVQDGQLDAETFRGKKWVKQESINKYIASLPKWAKEVIESGGEFRRSPKGTASKLTVTFNEELTTLIRVEAIRQAKTSKDIVQDIVVAALT